MICSNCNQPLDDPQDCQTCEQESAEFNRYLRDQSIASEKEEAKRILSNEEFPQHSTQKEWLTMYSDEALMREVLRRMKAHK